MTARPVHRAGLTLICLALFAVSVSAAETKPAYPFDLPPAKAITALQKLENLSGQKIRMSADEKALAEDVKDGKLWKWSMAEAALLASGVEDKQKRQTLLKQYKKIRTAAREAVAKEKTAADKGRKLLEHLHAGPMSKGYETLQTTLTGIFEDGKFNCVSSSVLYSALATDLGLEVDAVEVPGGSFSEGHVYARLKVEGKWVVVETTNAKGYGAERALGSSDRILSPAGLVALIWYNRGVGAVDKKNFHQAAVFSLLAMSLDPVGSAAGNVRASLVNWALSLMAPKKFSDAQLIHVVGLEIEPKNRELLNNRKVAFARWADHLAESSKIDDALDVLRKAIKENADETRFYEERQAWLFVGRGEKLIEKKQWQKAHDEAGAGQKKLTGKPLEELISWQKNVYLRWGNSLLDASEHEKALEVYEKGLKLYPDQRDLENNRWFTMQGWLQHTIEKLGEKKARELAGTLRKKHDGKREMDEILERHVHRIVEKLVEASKFGEARDALKRNERLLKKEQTLEMARWITRKQAEPLIAKDDWKAARAVYAAALKEHPGDSELAERAAGLWDAQAKKHIEKKEWKEAAALYEEGLKQFAQNGLLKNNLEYCREQMKNGK